MRQLAGRTTPFHIVGADRTATALRMISGTQGASILHARLALLLLGSDRSPNGRNRLRVTTATAALVEERFETVFYANADLLLSTGPYKQLSEQSANTLRLPFADLFGGLESLGAHASADLLSKADAVLIGARDFRPPATLGDVQS